MSRRSEYPSYLLFALLAFHSSAAAQQGEKKLPPAVNSAQGAGAAPSAAQQNPLIARVGPEDLRLVDLIREVNGLIPMNFYHKRIPRNRMEEFRKKAFDSLVLKRRIYLDALERKLPIEEKAIREKLKKALKNAGPEYKHLSKKRFDEELAKNRPQILRILLIEKNRARFEDSIPVVTEDSLRKVYDSRLKEDPTTFRAPREARLLHLFIKMDPSRTEKEMESKTARMTEAKAELDKGVAFSQVARLYSDGDKAKQGGDLGWVKQGTLRSTTLDEAAFQLKAGGVSGIIESLYGLHILKCIEIKPYRTLKFEEVKGMLRVWLTAEHKKLSMSRWQKELEMKYPLEILAPDLISPAESKTVGKKDGPETSPGKTPAASQPAKQETPDKPASTRPSSQPSKG